MATEEQEALLRKAESTLKRVEIYLKLKDEDRAMEQFTELNKLLRRKEKCFSRFPV